MASTHSRMYLVAPSVAISPSLSTGNSASRDAINEVVYSSPVIPIGSQLTDFKLDKPLSPGKYRAICQYVLIDDEENQAEISRANFIIKITVKN